MDSTTATTPAYRTYLVRCWPVQVEQPARRWRFVLVDLESGIRRGFADFDLMVAFLQAQLAGGAPAGEEGDTTS